MKAYRGPLNIPISPVECLLVKGKLLREESWTEEAKRMSMLFEAVKGSEDVWCWRGVERGRKKGVSMCLSVKVRMCEGSKERKGGRSEYVSESKGKWGHVRKGWLWEERWREERIKGEYVSWVRWGEYIHDSQRAKRWELVILRGGKYEWHVKKDVNE